MTLAQLISFIAAVAILYATPGPAMMLVAQTTMRHGARAALITVAALSAGEAVLVFAAAAGLALAANLAQPVFAAVAWVGLVYLLWRAGRAWRELLTPSHPNVTVPDKAATPLALPGLAVAFANPATLIFFTALLPQFVVPGGDQAEQLFLLAATYVVAVVVFDVIFVVMLARLTSRGLARLPRRAGALCNALALSAIAAFVIAHAMGGMSSVAAWPAQAVAAAL